MAFNGSGTYNPVSVPVVTGTTISSTAFNATITDIATALTDCVTRDGQSPATANLPMGTFKLTGLGVGSALTDSPTLGQVQNQLPNWGGTAGGTANALTITPSPAITAYAAGQVFRFKAGASPNSGATTLAISGLTTIAIQVNGAACAGGEILASQFYEVILDTTSTCQLLGIGLGSISHSPSAGIGYGTGAGGTVTQLTNKSTGVTLNTVCGQIIMNNASLANGVSVPFVLTNSQIGPYDVVVACIDSQANNGSYDLIVDRVGAGGGGICWFWLRNVDVIPRSDAVVIRFAIIKAAIS